MYVCIHVCAGAHGAQRSWIPGTGATGSGELPNLGFKHSLQSSAGVDVLLDTELSLQPPISLYYFLAAII